jgi:hypothetical protein
MPIAPFNGAASAGASIEIKRTDSVLLLPHRWTVDLHKLLFEFENKSAKV